MGRSIFSKLTRTFLIFSILIVFSVGFTSNYLFQREFNKYLKNTNLKTMKDIIIEIEDIIKKEKLEDNLGKRDINRLINRNGYNATIVDSEGKTIFESTMHGMKSGNNMDSENKLYYSQNIMINGEKGKIYIYLKQDHMISEESDIFKKSLSKSYTINSIILIIFSLIISYFFSKSISKPIVKLVEMTEEIEKGNYKIENRDKKKNFIEVEKLEKSIENMAETLYNQDNFRRKFISDITHEIKTPIAIIKSQIEAIEEGIMEFDKESLKMLDEEVDFLNNIFMDLKKLNNLDKEDDKLKLEEVRLDLELKNIVKGFKMLYLKKGIEIIENFEELSLKLDKEKFKQFIGNILINSYKYSKENKKVIVSLKEINRKTILSIEDEGIGIPEEDLKYVFERFYRSEKSRNRKSGGLGIGLTIVKRIADLHNWKIKIESEVNVGTKVIIELNNKESAR